MLKLKHLDRALRHSAQMEVVAWKVVHGGSRAAAAAPPALAYTRAESDEAAEGWGANCGPHSLAAALGLTMNEVRDCRTMLDFPGWTNPTRIEDVLRELDVPFQRRSELRTKTFCSGINRVQWEGSWLNPGVPVAAAYAHTHWVAQYSGHVLCAMLDGAQWLPIADWSAEVERRGKPWHVTHHYVIRRDAR